MTINENDRLDLRQEFERIFKNPRLAEIAMEAMPPLDYSQFSTRQDLAALDTKLQAQFINIDARFAEIDGRFAQIDGRFAQLRGEITEMKGELKLEMANSLRIMVASQIVTMGILGAWISAVT